MTRVLPYLWYPLFFAAAAVAYGLLLSHGVAPVAAVYPPIVFAGIAILLLEWKFPERLDWRPRWADVRADAAFMAVVQVLLPRALAALALILVADSWHDPSSSPWPHHWPLAAQILAMVLAVDFLRYWLHRACHSVTPLWKLHEVHHSPDILYLLNVGRFHPLEKLLHFGLDTVPFLMLGVAPEVIAGYFLAYSVNGFFQHSNVRLRYGVLNYIVGSAETHRWHHARDPKIAQCNFGNTTLLWDLLFGTWFLPRDGRTLDIGITDRDYPRGFVAQMFTPFGRPRQDPRRRLANFAVSASLRLARAVEMLRLAAALRDPMREQRRVLARLLRDNRDTSFGRRHGFSGITSAEQYAACVPVSDFEALRPYIDAEIGRGEAALTREAPLRYLRTSGSTGQPKDVPLILTHLRFLRRIHRLAVASQHRICPEAFVGSILAIVSPREEGRLANGKPYGSASGIVSGNTPGIVRDKFVLPQEVLTIADSRLKYLTILRLALPRRDLTYIGSANPTTLLVLVRLYAEHQHQLVADLQSGGFFRAGDLPDDVFKALQGRLGAVPQRAAELLRLQAAGRAPRLHELWPELRGVMMWTCGSAGVAAAAVRQELDARTRVFELGYVASEFRGTVTLGRRPGSGLPTLFAHFFEFVERERWDRGEPEFLTLDRLRKGRDYYLIVSTPSGLYRYFINDIVRVTGHLHRTPLLKFVQKGRGVTSITGEKLYEGQVLAAVQGAAADAGLTLRFVKMLADEQAQTYRLYAETDAAAAITAAEFALAVDTRLQAINIEYAAKRESGRLATLSAAWLQPETGEAYKQFCVGLGQREGQFKPAVLAYLRETGFDFEAKVRR